MLAIVTLSTATTGLLFFILGRCNGGRLIRFVPQPMIGGFNAASGVLLVLGAVRASPHLAQIAAGAGFGMLLLALRRLFGPIALPAGLLASLAVAPAVAWATHSSFTTLRADGWLFSLAGGTPWLLWTTAPGAIDWGVVFAHAPDIVVVAIVAAAALLLNSTGLELLSGDDVDLDRELRIAGIGNLLGGCLGALPSYASFSRSATNYSLGTRGRSVGTIVAISAAAILAIGPQRVINAVPVFAPAGLLIAVGGELAYRWLIASRQGQSRGDYATIWLIVVTVVSAGFVAGIVAGLAAGCVAFVIRYSRVDAVARRLTAATMHSRLQRSHRDTTTLIAQGNQIRIFALRGYIFFGVADRLYRELLVCAQNIDGPGWILLDFTEVMGMDSSAASAFVKLLRNIDAERITVVFAGMNQRIASRWHRSLVSDVRLLAFDDLDLALEWCETAMLRLYESYSDAPSTLELWLAEQIGGEHASLVASHMQRIDLDTGDVLCLAGDISDRMFFIASGRTAVIVGDEHPRRILSIASQSIVGEMGLFRQVERSATVVAEIPTVAFALTRDALDAIEAEHPDAATALHAAIIRLLSDRLAHQTELVSTLLH
jgi:SulP family sulfate permease